MDIMYIGHISKRLHGYYVQCTMDPRICLIFVHLCMKLFISDHSVHSQLSTISQQLFLTRGHTFVYVTKLALC